MDALLYGFLITVPVQVREREHDDLVGREKRKSMYVKRVDRDGRENTRTMFAAKKYVERVGNDLHLVSHAKNPEHLADKDYSGNLLPDDA